MSILIWWSQTIRGRSTLSCQMGSWQSQWISQALVEVVRFLPEPTKLASLHDRQKYFTICQPHSIFTITRPLATFTYKHFSRCNRHSCTNPYLLDISTSSHIYYQILSTFFINSPFVWNIISLWRFSKLASFIYLLCNNCLFDCSLLCILSLSTVCLLYVAIVLFCVCLLVLLGSTSAGL